VITVPGANQRLLAEKANEAALSWDEG